MTERNAFPTVSRIADRPGYNPKHTGGDGNGGEPPMSDLIARVEHLERDVGDIKTTLARMEGRFETMDAKFDAKFDAMNEKLDTFATKADLSDTKTEIYQALNAQTWKIIGLMGVMTALFTTIVKWL